SRSPSVTFRDDLRPSAGLHNDRYFSGRSRRRDDRHPVLAYLLVHSRAPIPRGGFRPTAHRENMADQAVRNALPLSSPPATPYANTRLVRGVLSHLHLRKGLGCSTYEVVAPATASARV